MDAGQEVAVTEPDDDKTSFTARTRYVASRLKVRCPPALVTSCANLPSSA